MGKTNQKLTISVAPEFHDHPAVQALRDKGHDVVILAATADLILHPNAHQWADTMWEYLEVALKAARAKKYPKKKGGKK